MTAFYRRAVTEILEIEEARKLLDEEGIWYRGFKKGRGLIGALAAVGADAAGLHLRADRLPGAAALGHAAAALMQSPSGKRMLSPIHAPGIQ